MITPPRPMSLTEITTASQQPEKKETTKMTRTYLFKKSDFIKTNALRKFREENNLTNKGIADMAAAPIHCVSLWITRGRAPRQVLTKLGISARNTANRPSIAPEPRNAPKANGGGVAVCLLRHGRAERPVFGVL